MCSLFYACSYDQVYDLIKLVMVCALFVVVPLVLVIGFLMVEMQKRSGIDLDAILDAARRRTTRINGRSDDAL